MCKKQHLPASVLSLLLSAGVCHASYTITIDTSPKSIGVHNGNNTGEYLYFPRNTYITQLCSDSENNAISSALISGGVRVTIQTIWDNGKTDEWTQWGSICKSTAYDVWSGWHNASSFAWGLCRIRGADNQNMCGKLPVDMRGAANGYVNGTLTVPARTLAATRPRQGRNIVSTRVNAMIVRHSPFGTAQLPVVTTTTVSYNVETPDITIPATVPASCVRGGASITDRSYEETGRFDITISNLETPPTIEFVPQVPENMTGVKVIYHDTLSPKLSGALDIAPVENGSVRRSGYFELQCGDFPAGQYEIPVTMKVTVD